MRWPPAWTVFHPSGGWTLDATRMRIDAAAFDALPWDRAFAEMEALEGGAIANPDEGRQVGHYWLRAPERAPTMGQARAIGETVEALRAFAEGVRRGKIVAADGLPFTEVLHVGIGGSALGPALLVDALSGLHRASRALEVQFVDNTDPDGVQRLLQRIGDRLAHTLVLVATKSGTTPETRNGLALVRAALQASGLDAAQHLVAITTPGSKLEAAAHDEGWRAVFHLWEETGGRFSVTSAVGLLPAELAGIPSAPLLEGAATVDAWTRETDARQNPAAVLAGAWFLAGNGVGDRAMVVLPYADRLVLLSRYLQQLVMESLGKRLDRAGREVFQGLTVYGNKGSTDQHAYVQQLRDGRDDFFAVFVQVLGSDAPDVEVQPGVNTGDHLQGLLLGTRRALTEGGRRSLTLTVPEVDERVLGGLIALFERAVGLYASLIDVNAYHQPGVEAGKKAAKALLTGAAALQAAAAGGPADVATLAEASGLDALEAWYVAERRVRTGRLAREGTGPAARYRRRRGSEG